MTAARPPQQPQQAPPPPPEEVTAPEADGSHLIPVLTTILAAYLAYAAGHGAVKGTWQTVVKTLGLDEIAGKAFGQQAERALARVHAELHHHAIELWFHSSIGIKEGTDAGMQKMVSVLKHTDTIDSTTPRDIHRLAEDMARTISYAAQNGEAVAATNAVSTAPAPAPARTPAAEPDGTPAAEEAAGTTKTRTKPPAAKPSAPTEKQVWMKRWKSRHDLRVRYTHAHLDGVSVPVTQSFVTLDGNDIRYPHDPRAPMAETAGCRCRLEIYADR